MYVTAVRHILETGQGVILDRSVYSDIVFAEKNRMDGNISVSEYRYYLALRKQLLEGLPFPHIVLYLDVKPELCFQRIMQRKRECESGIPLDYLQGLDHCYRNMLRGMEELGSCVLTLQWDNFGASANVVHAVNAARRVPVSRWIPDIEGLRKYISSRRSLESSMRMSVRPRGVEDDEFGVEFCDELLDLENSLEEKRLKALQKTEWQHNKENIPPELNVFVC
eukprot:GCRY01004628.1.p1 GENE.GCRY01004628.1~~GCRY01004628.1.p1  ORF type:complete len:237 (-),score=32.46 GCRY01004628.1:176-844(-)